MRHLMSLLVLSTALTACQSADTTGQRSEGFAAPDRAMVYEAAWNALRQQGFTPDSSASSQTTGVIVTRHKLSMAPFSGQGFRDQATVRIHEVPQHAHHYTVEVNVLREFNDNIKQPSNPVAADWRTGVREPDLENLIKSRVEMMFISPDASAEFKSSHGMSTETRGRLPGESTGAPPPRDGDWFPPR